MSARDRRSRSIFIRSFSEMAQIYETYTLQGGQILYVMRPTDITSAGDVEKVIQVSLTIFKVLCQHFSDLTSHVSGAFNRVLWSYRILVRRRKVCRSQQPDGSSSYYKKGEAHGKETGSDGKVSHGRRSHLSHHLHHRAMRSGFRHMRNGVWLMLGDTVRMDR